MTWQAETGVASPRSLVEHAPVYSACVTGFAGTHPLWRCLMYFRLAADGVLLLHLAFIVFVLFGAVLATRWRWMPWLHVPAAAWGFFVELTGRICPLTFLENDLRLRAGQSGYAESFVEHYLVNVIYPPGLTREIQFGLAAVVLVINFTIYAWLVLRRLAISRQRNRG